MSDQKLKILQVNIQSLEKNKEEISRVLIKDEYDVAFISESWSKKEFETTKYKIPGFFTFLDSRDDGFGGAGVILSKKLKSREIELPKFPKLQAVARNIVSLNIVVLSLYAAPCVSHSDLKEALKLIFDEIRSYKRAIIGGDFNAHHLAWDPLHEDRKGDAVFELINEYNLILLNTGQATFIPVDLRQSPSAIDLVLATPEIFHDTIMRTLSYGIGSRHVAIEITINWTNKQGTRFFLNKQKIVKGVKELSGCEVMDVKDLQLEVKKLIKGARQKSKFQPKFWWSPETEKAWVEKNEARNRFNQTGGMTELLDLKKKEALFNKIKKESSRQRFKEFIEAFDPQTPSKVIWDKLRSISGRRRKIENVLVHDDPKLAEEFLNKHFPTEFFRENSPSFRPNYDILTSEHWDKFLGKKKKTSAPGPDGISYGLLKSLQPEVKNNIIRSLNETWRTNNIAENLKTIKIIAIPKPGKDPESLDGTRPLSMINCTLKILNSAVLTEFESYLETKQILPELSFGFRKRKSTVECLEYVTNRILLNKRKGLLTATIFVDLSNAFNAVKTEVLEDILIALESPPQYISWFRSFLTNRKLVLQVAGEQMIRFVSQGLPQGDILSPTLFNVYTKKLHDIQVEGIILVQYADDFAIIIEGKNLDEINQRGKEYMKLFEETAKELNFVINGQKTKAMLFLNSPKEVDITIGGNKIESVRSHPYLGMIIDRSLNFGAHIRNLTKRLGERMNMLKVIGGTRYGCHPQTMGMAYNAFFRSFIEYGSSVYGSAAKTHLNKIDVINNQCLRRISGCTKTTPKNTLQAIVAQPPLMYRRLRATGKQIAKHYYFDSTVRNHLEYVMNYERITEENQHKFSMTEKLAVEHHTILENLSNLVQSTNVRNVQIETEISGEVWHKKTTSTKVLKQLTLALIHGKYSGRQIIYTDASSNLHRCGIGIYHEPHLRLSLVLENFVCIMSAELEAIWVALQHITRNGLRNVVIMTDSKAGCTLLKNSLDLDERDEILDGILNMAAISGTTIQWIPGHTGTHGNEMADTLAKAALELPLNPDTICNNKIYLHDAVNHFNNLCDESSQQWYLKYSAEQGKGRKYFQFQNVIPCKPWYHNSKLSSEGIRTINRLLAGHDYSRYWLFKMKIESDCICEVCNSVENGEHILFFCVKYAETRRKFLLDKFSCIYQLIQIKDTALLQNVTKFLKEIGKSL